jgi:hypothetical protein
MEVPAQPRSERRRCGGLGGHIDSSVSALGCLPGELAARRFSGGRQGGGPSAPRATRELQSICADSNVATTSAFVKASTSHDSLLANTTALQLCAICQRQLSHAPDAWSGRFPAVSDRMAPSPQRACWHLVVESDRLRVASSSRIAAPPGQ